MKQPEDQIAIRILKAIARTRIDTFSNVVASPNLVAALRNKFGDVNETFTSEGDLARAALELLSQDPEFAEPIRVMTMQCAQSGQSQRYVEPTTIALATAVLVVLQTRIKFKADHSGKWSIDVDKKSAADATLKLVVQRLLPFLQK